MRVHLLITVRNPALWQASSLVFRTIRTGFPTAKVVAHVNGDVPNHVLEEVDADALLFNPGTVHHDWIDRLCATETEPFWICDTDVIFWNSMEQFAFGGPIAGRYTPRFRCPVLGAIYAARLHTAVMRIDPAMLKEPQHKTPFAHDHAGIRPIEIHMRGLDGKRDSLFYDTMAGVYHRLGGQHFTEKHLDCFDHLNCGTWSDIAGLNLRNGHAEIYKDMTLAKGIWRTQERWYAQRAA